MTLAELLNCLEPQLQHFTVSRVTAPTAHEITHRKNLELCLVPRESCKCHPPCHLVLVLGCVMGTGSGKERSSVRCRNSRRRMLTSHTKPLIPASGKNGLISPSFLLSFTPSISSLTGRHQGLWQALGIMRSQWSSPDFKDLTGE